MNNSIKTAIAFLLLPLAAASQAAEPPSPIAAAELYIRTLVNHDEQAISQLNDYLRPDRLRSGRSADNANAAELKEADKDFPREIADVALPLFPEAQRNALRAPVESLMSTVQKTRQQSQCKTVSASKPRLDKHGVLNTEVKFSCQLVKTPETWAEGIQRMVRNKLSVDQVQGELKKLQAAYSAPANHTYEGTLSLGMVPKDKDKAWRNDFARETFDEMFSEL